MDKTTKIIIVAVMMIPVVVSFYLLTYFKNTLKNKDNVNKTILEAKMKKALTIAVIIAVFFGITLIVFLTGGILG